MMLENGNVFLFFKNRQHNTGLLHALLDVIKRGTAAPPAANPAALHLMIEGALLTSNVFI